MTLTALEARILGSLIEKEQTTPAVYPLTINALVTACNQTSSREPVMSVSESDTARALESLQSRKLVWQVVGGRAVRWQHNLERAWNLDAAQRALVALLLLRGAQTAGELRTRSERLHPFDSVAQVEEVLDAMAKAQPPLAVHASREAGRRELRWTSAMHPVEAHEEPLRAHVSKAPLRSDLAARIEALESATASLEASITLLSTKLGV